MADTGSSDQKRDLEFPRPVELASYMMAKTSYTMLQIGHAISEAEDNGTWEDSNIKITYDIRKRLFTFHRKHS